MKIVVAPQARDDLKIAYDYIAQDNPHAADRFLARVVEVIGLLATEALEGARVCSRSFESTTRLVARLSDKGC